MKRITLFFIALFACLFVGVQSTSAAASKKAAPKTPEFVTSGDGGTYYYVKFLRNEKVMSVSSDNCIRLYSGSGVSSVRRTTSSSRTRTDSTSWLARRALALPLLVLLTLTRCVRAHQSSLVASSCRWLRTQTTALAGRSLPTLSLAITL